MKFRTMSSALITSVLIVLSRGTSANAQSNNVSIYPGETLTYVVEYMTLELASVKFEIVNQIDTMGTTLYHARAEIKSNPKWPLIRVSDQYDAYFDQSYTPYYYKGRGLSGNFSFRLEYIFDQIEKQIDAKEYRTKHKDEALHNQITEDIGPNIRDTLTLFYFLRQCSRNRNRVDSRKYPAFVGLKRTPVEFRRQKEPKTIMAAERKIRAVPAHIRVEHDGMAGARGKIKLSYSDDDRAIPLFAEVKLRIGKAKIRLVAYKSGRPALQTAHASGGQVLGDFHKLR